MPHEPSTSDGTSRRFSRNVRWLTASSILYRVVSVLLAMYIARRLGAGILGQYAAVTNIITLYLSFADLGITNLVIRDVSRDRGRTQEVLDTFFGVQFASALVLALAALATGMLAGYGSEAQIALAVGAAGLVASALATVYNALLSAHERIYPFAAIELVCLVVFTAGNVLVVVTGSGLVALVAVTTVVALVKVLLGAAWAARHGIAVRGWPAWRTAGALLAAGLPFLLINGAHYAVQRLDVVLLSAMRGDERTGVYAASSRLVFASLFFVSAVGTALYPVFSRLLAGARERAREVYERGTVVLVAAGAAAALVFRQVAAEGIPLLYGAGYDDAVPVLRLLALYIPLFAWGLLASNVLMTGGRAWHAVAVSVLALAVMLVATPLLVGAFELRGAALAVVLAEMAATAGYVLAARGVFGGGFRRGRAAASVFMLFLVSSYVGDLLPAWVGLASSLLIYLVSLHMLRLVRLDDVRGIVARTDGEAA